MKHFRWFTSGLFTVILALGCSSGSGVTPADVQIGDGVDAADQEGEVPTDVAVPDGDVLVPDEVSDPDVDVVCDECEEGEIRCDGDYRYWVCELKNNCWKWGSKSLCPASQSCVCKALGEEICVPDNQPCACVPDCTGKECGANGCGSYCGTGLANQLGCQLGHFCDSGTCKPDADCAVGGGECSEGETLCNGDKVTYCVDIFAENPNLPECWMFYDTQDCPNNEVCQNDQCTCSTGVTCGGTCCDSAAHTCLGQSCCLPNCVGKACGSDGCGGNCGTCPVATPHCFNGQCEVECIVAQCTVGQQKCKGPVAYQKCIEVQGCPQWSDQIYGCPANNVCTPAQGKCECVPNCAGRTCGSDGCGGSCGTCPFQTECNNTLGKCYCLDTTSNPVCDITANPPKTYNNECAAILGGASSWVKGNCPTCHDLCTADEKTPIDICGQDGLTYFSFCELKCALGTPLCVDLWECPQIQYLGACAQICFQGCPQLQEPICGQKGGEFVTFCNRCDYLGKSLQAGGPYQGATYFCAGECLKDTLCSAVCPNTCDPVCGSLPNGTRRSYINQCVLDCEGATLLEEGRCCTECGQYDDWVCSSVFHAYQNECIMMCKADHEAPTLYTIPVAPDGEVRVDICEDCQCDLSPINVELVCGSDYITYDNACALACGGQQYVVCEDECGFDTCPCPIGTGGYAIASEETTPPNPQDNLRRGVCGADGRTYGNTCSAVYSGTFVVQDIWCPTCASQCSGVSYDPVCCDDNVTYPNLCILEKCNGIILPAFCRKGKCCIVDADCDDGNAGTSDSCNLGVCENL